MPFNPFEGQTQPTASGPQDRGLMSQIMSAGSGLMQGARDSGINFQNVGSNLMDMYNKNRIRKDAGRQAADLQALFGANSPYAQQMGKQMLARDAASGRRSNVNGRSVELAAKLAELNSKNAPMINQLTMQQGSARNGMLGDLYRMATGGPNGGNLIGAGQKYFNNPAEGNRYGLVGANPVSDYNYQNGSDLDIPKFADGGEVRREPVIGSRSPVREGGGGGMSREAIIRAAQPASAPQPRYVDPLNPRSVNAERERNMARGGPVRGPGGPRTDSIPARLSNGEHVMDEASVTALGGGDNATGQAILNAMRAHAKGAR
jgi:hypothetical protein